MNWNSLEEYKLVIRALCWSVIIAAIALLTQVPAEGDDVPSDPARAHQHADGIYGPEFDAAYNRFRATHPVDRKPGTWDHVHRNDVGDAERWKDAERKFDLLRRAMKRAGYE
jgi:hypothetical protein